jgi:hypothetical protein
MRLLKILIIVVFIASITNANVCSNVLFQKKGSDSRNRQFIISNFENTTAALIYDRPDQAGKKTMDINSLHKIILTSSAKNKFPHIGNQEILNITAAKINDYSLISLHCLLTI